MNSPFSNIASNDIIVSKTTPLPESLPPFDHDQKHGTAYKANESCRDERILQAHVVNPRRYPLIHGQSIKPTVLRGKGNGRKGTYHNQ